MKSMILPPSRNTYLKAKSILDSGGVVAIPTETVYGLAANAFDHSALLKIFKTKERPQFDPLIVHIAKKPNNHTSYLEYLSSLELVDLSQISSLLKTAIETLCTEFWPGPLTLILPKHSKVPDLVTSGLKTVAIRMPNHEVAQNLLQNVNYPLAAPSANRFGKISPTSANAVFQELGDRIELIIDGGTCTIGIESTILGLSPEKQFIIHRPGIITKDHIENILGLKVRFHKNQTGEPVFAPGNLASHYAPDKKLFLLPRHFFEMSKIDKVNYFKSLYFSADAKAGFILVSNILDTNDFFNNPSIRFNLSKNSNLDEIALNLFLSLRQMDQSDIDVIFFQTDFDRSGIGEAILDRLTRASTK